MKSFKCPHCGSNQLENKTINVSVDSNSLWNNVCSVEECLSCNYWIPEHLSRRWNNISYFKAVIEWRAYKEYNDNINFYCDTVGEI